jgi:hypothetical protein
MRDDWEQGIGLDPLRYDAHLDPDGDGWMNRSEFEAGPLNPFLNTQYPRPMATFIFKYQGAADAGPIMVTAYHSAAMDGLPDATLEVAAPDGGYPYTFTTNVMTTGHLREGKNWFFAWIDVNGNGSWDAGEPAGVSEQQASQYPANSAYVGWSDVGPITIGLAASQPRHSLQGFSLPGYARFSWAPAAQTTKYYLFIRDTGGMAVFERQMNAPRTYFHEGDFMYAGKRSGMSMNSSYQWFVYTNLQAGTAIANGAFQVSYPDSLSTPTPVTPQGAVFQYAQNELEWTAPAASVEFTVQISTNSGFGSVLWGATIVAPAREAGGTYRYTPPVFGDTLPNGAYYWRVQAKNPTATSGWMPARSFQINMSDGPIGPYSISGDTWYFGKVTNGTIVVQAFKGAGFGSQPVAQAKIVNSASSNSWPMNVTSFSLPGLHAGSYYVRGFLDQNGNLERDSWETWGFAGTPYLPTPVALPPSAKNVKVQLVFADTDQDRIVDDWEYFYGVTVNPSAPLTVMGPGSVISTNPADGWYTDSNSDGLNDYDSYAATPMNVSPINPNSALADGIPLRIKTLFGLDLFAPLTFEVSNISVDAAGHAVIKWRSPLGGAVTTTATGKATQSSTGAEVYYQVQYSTNLVTWTDVPGTGVLAYDAVTGEFKFTHTLQSRVGNYRYKFTWK